MTSPETVHAHPQSRDSTTVRVIESNTAPVQNVESHDHGNKTVAIIALVLSGAALGGVLVLAILMHIYWAESRLANLNYDDMKAAMLARGMNPNPHMERESP